MHNIFVLRFQFRPRSYFKVNRKSSPNLVIGYNSELEPVYKPYVSKTNEYAVMDRYGNPLFIGGLQITEKLKDLYKYQGNVTKDGVKSGVFVRVDKAGFSNNNGKVFEFKNTENKGKSVIPGNNRGLNEDMLEKFSSLANPKRPGAVDTKVVKFAEEMYEAEEAEADKKAQEEKELKESKDVFSEMKTNNGELLSELITDEDWNKLNKEENIILSDIEELK